MSMSQYDPCWGAIDGGTCGKCRGMLIICWCLMMPTDCGDWELAKVFWMVSFTKMQQPVWIFANICHLRRFTSHALMQQDLVCSFQFSLGDRWLWHIGVWRWRAGQCWECCIPVSSFARTFRLQGTLVSNWQKLMRRGCQGAIVLWQCFQFKPFFAGNQGSILKHKRKALMRTRWVQHGFFWNCVAGAIEESKDTGVGFECAWDVIMWS